MRNLLIRFGGIFFTFILTMTAFLNIGKTSPAFAETSRLIEPYSFSATPGTQAGTVKITWYDDGSAKTYNLLYGTDINHFTFGVVDMAHGANRANEFTVGYLIPGQTYYFKLIGIRGGEDTESGPIIAQAASNTSLAIKSTYYSSSKNYEMPYLFAINYGNSSGTVNITWFDDDTANKYDIVYGLSPGNYVYGLQNMPYRENLSNTFTIGALSPGRNYYFALVAERNNSIVSWSQPLSINVR